MTILDEIAEKTRERIAKEKGLRPLENVRREAEEAAAAAGNQKAGEEKTLPAFERALARKGMSFICEVKKASPSRGVIAREFPYLQIAREYEAGGAAAISCLTEPFYFLGQDAYLREIAAAVKIPVLRKDFTVDEYMIYQARALGAEAVLLICSLLDDSRLKDWICLAGELGMSALVEAHNEREICRAADCGARIIGVNNRNLKDFTVDTENSSRLRSLAPPSVLFVAESGIADPDQVRRLAADGVDAVLVGEALMRGRDKKAALWRLSGGEEKV